MKFLSDMISKRKQAEDEGVVAPREDDVADFPLPEFSASGEASQLPQDIAPRAAAPAAPQPAPQPVAPAAAAEDEADDGSYDWDLKDLDLSPDVEDEPPASLEVPAKSVSFEDTLVEASDDDGLELEEEEAPVEPQAGTAAISDVERRLRASIARMPGEDEDEAPAAPAAPAAKRSSFIADSVRSKRLGAPVTEDAPEETEMHAVEEGEPEDPETLLIDPELGSFDEDPTAEDAFDAVEEDAVQAEFEDAFANDDIEDDDQETLQEAIEVLEEASAEFDEVEEDVEAYAEETSSGEVDVEDDDEDDLEETEAYSPLEQLRAMREEARANVGSSQDAPADPAGMNALASFFANDADADDDFEDEAEEAPFEESVSSLESQFEDEEAGPVAEYVERAPERTIVDMPAAEDAGAPTEEAETMEAPEAAKSDFEDPEIDAIAAPRRRAGGRVKTRLLGFHKPDEANADPISAARAKQEDGEPRFAVGWVVVVKGPGRGASFTLHSGASTIGRGDNQTVRLDFGDTSISRENHAVVAYDDEQKRFFIGHGGKANLVRLDDMPVLSTEPLHHGNIIRIGETSLMFIALCSDEFSWTDGPFAENTHAAE